ncbi:MAG: alpha-ketoglutarate-dependent dioxygenase AlkB [Bacteroidia bacterium]
MDLFNTDESSGTTIHTFDLPDADIVFYKHFFTNHQSDELFGKLKENIRWQQDKIKLYGKIIDLPRLTAWYGGKAYGYSGITMPVHPFTDELLLIKSAIEKAADVKFTGVLLNYYRNGNDSVSWHSDDEKELGKNPIIASVSFGATRTFQLRHKTRKDLEKPAVSLSHGSLLLMKGSTQHFWEHQVPKISKPTGPRINLTFRNIQSN